MFENGAGYLLIDNSCTFWSYDASDGRVIYGQLSDIEKADWEHQIPLRELGSAQRAALCAAPGDVAKFRYADKTTIVDKPCPGDEESSPLIAHLRNSMSLIRDGLKSGRWNGKMWDGDLRILVVKDGAPTTETGSFHKGAPTWPLTDIEPSTVAISPEEASSPSWRLGAKTLQNEHATNLRQAYNNYIATNQGGAAPMNGVPFINASSGNERVLVWARDRIPMESDTGTLSF